MTNTQLYLAMGVPMLFNTVLIGFLWAHLTHLMNVRFDAINTRFDDMKDMWAAKLEKVEEILDARLKHLEERMDR